MSNKKYTIKAWTVFIGIERLSQSKSKKTVTILRNSQKDIIIDSEYIYIYTARVKIIANRLVCM